MLDSGLAEIDLNVVDLRFHQVVFHKVDLGKELELRLLHDVLKASSLLNDDVSVVEVFFENQSQKRSSLL